MSRAGVRTAWIAAVAWAMLTPFAGAQTMYRCDTGSGMHLSDRPCSVGALPPIKASGPMPSAPLPQRTEAPPPGQVPEIRPFLSAECAQFNDAVRTGPARGLKGETMSALADEYNRRCGADEQLAHQRLRLSRSADPQQRQQAQSLQSAEQARAKLTVDQCAEMRRILATKRQRAASMAAGERNDLDLFEANYQSRCKGG